MKKELFAGMFIGVVFVAFAVFLMSLTPIWGP